MLCQHDRMTSSNWKVKNGNLQFTVTEDLSSICILTSEFNRNLFFKCLNINSTVNLASYCYLFTYVLPKASRMLSKAHRSALMKNAFIFSSATHFYGAHSTFNLSLSNIYLRIQLVHLRQKN